MCSPLKRFLLIVPLKATIDFQTFDSDSTVCSLTPLCHAHCGTWFRGVMYTAQFLRNLGHLTPQWDAHCGAWLHGGMHTAESDSSTSKMSVSVFSNSWRLSITFYRKTSELKKIPLTIFDFQYNFHSNSLRHHREITIVKFRIKLTFGKLLTSRCASHRGTWLRGMKDTAESDSVVWRTPRSLTPRYDADCGVF